MPWDSDVDVQVSASTIHFLASYYNMTIHRYKGRSYMLEINPRYVNGSAADYLNMIDGRYIDMDKGLFIDITTVRPKQGSIGKLTCKDRHEYEVSTRRLMRAKAQTVNGHGSIGSGHLSIARECV